jgi:hypothetical protein
MKSSKTSRCNWTCHFGRFRFTTLRRYILQRWIFESLNRCWMFGCSKFSPNAAFISRIKHTVTVENDWHSQHGHRVSRMGDRYFPSRAASAMSNSWWSNFTRVNCPTMPWVQLTHNVAVCWHIAARLDRLGFRLWKIWNNDVRNFLSHRTVGLRLCRCFNAYYVNSRLL